MESGLSGFLRRITPGVRRFLRATDLPRAFVLRVLNFLAAPGVSLDLTQLRESARTLPTLGGHSVRIFSPSSGKPITTPSQDTTLSCYYHIEQCWSFPLA